MLGKTCKKCGECHGNCCKKHMAMGFITALMVVGAACAIGRCGCAMHKNERKCNH